MSQPAHITIAPLKPSAIPSEQAIIAAGRALIDTIPSWKQGKTYHDVVKGFSRPKGPNDGAAWHCRLSEHPAEQATFDEMWATLGVDKALHEIEFMPDIDHGTLIKTLSPTAAIWSLHYKFPSPMSPRVFSVLQVTHLEDDKGLKTGIIVSLPIDLSSSEDAELAKLEEKGVKGRYASVERIQELENGHTEWLMATSSTPGGFLPTFVVEASVASMIPNDVPLYMNWLAQRRDTAA